MIGTGRNFLVISDLQIPFEHSSALRDAIRIKKYFNIPDSNVLCVGDEVDQYFGSLYKKDINANLTATQEINECKKIVREWGKAFPRMKLATSNHGLRWAKKATDAEIPSQLLISYRDMIGAPKGWVWKDEWIFDTKHPFRMIHGMGYSGKDGARNALIDSGISTVMGHLHSHACVGEVNGKWFFNVGCYIDVEAFAFAYGKYSRHKPCLGHGVILNDGSLPIRIPSGAI